MKTTGNLESVVDPPLETGERADHDDTSAETIPQTSEADSSVDFADGAALLVHDGDKSVSGVRNNSTEDTSPVTGNEGDHQLEVLGVRFAGGGENVGVESTDGLLESNELHNGVGDLSAPERNDTLVETGPALSLHDLGPCLTESGGEGAFVRGLDSDFNLQTRIWL